MKLLKHILLTLLICLTSGCSGSKMEPINEDMMNNNENDLDSILTLDSEDANTLLLDNENQNNNNNTGDLALVGEPPRRSVQQAVRPAAPHPPPRPVSPRVVAPPPVQQPPVQQPPVQQPPALVQQARSLPCQSGCPQVAPTPPCNANTNTFGMTNTFISPQMKIVFVVDKGSHNYIPTKSSPSGNDSYRATRVHHVREFFNSHRNRQFAWGVITFQGASGGREGYANAYIYRDNKDDRPIFTGDYNLIAQAINKLSTQPDGSEKERDNNGQTQYGKALDLTKKLIEEDLDRNEDADNAIYLVYFISGQAPSNRYNDRYPLDEYDYDKVEEIVGLKPGKVFFSTAYYGWAHLAAEPDRNANPGLDVVDILQEMASIGNGRFFNLTNIRGEQVAHQGYAPISPCQQQAPVPLNSRCRNVVEDDYYDHTPSFLDLPTAYPEPQQQVTSPCAAANNNNPAGSLGLPIQPQPALLPCGHSEAVHARGQCPLLR